MEEIWRSIEIEGYEVSNFGRVRSVDRTVKGINGVVQNFKGQLIKPFISKEGYGRSYIGEINKLKESNLKYLLI